MIPNLTEEEIANTDFGTYTDEQYFDDLCRIDAVSYRRGTCKCATSKSIETVIWMREKKVRFTPIYGRQVFKIEGKFKFIGGLTIVAVGGGTRSCERTHEAADREGITVVYEAAFDLISDDEGVHGVRLKLKGKTTEIKAKFVVLAVGGFQSNAEIANTLSWP